MPALRIVGAGVPAIDSRPSGALTVGELKALIIDCLADVQAAPVAAPAVGPALLDRAGLAAALGISLASADRARARGLPTVFVGGSPRFSWPAVREWLSGGAGGAPTHRKAKKETIK
jgi:hypothetical protein